MELKITSTETFNDRPLMTEEQWRPWKEALLSGEYKRGRIYLNDGEGEFCCLGVLCDVQGRCQTHLKHHVVTYDNQTAALSETNPLYEYLNTQGHFKGFEVDGYYSLADMNDSDKYTFEEIAYVIQMYMVEKPYAIVIEDSTHYNAARKLSREDAAEWLAALRSGKYKQTTHVLKKGDDHFCCLGVACDLEGLTIESYDTALPDASKFFGVLGNSGTFPNFRVRCNYIHRSTTSLAGCNDLLRLKFNHIADIIEGYLCK